MSTVRKGLSIALFVLVLVAGWRFAYENDAVVHIDYVIGRTAEITLWKALLLATGVGAGLTGAWLGLALMRSRLEARRYRKEMMNLEAEVHQLRNLPAVAVEPEVAAVEEGAVQGH